MHIREDLGWIVGLLITPLCFVASGFILYRVFQGFPSLQWLSILIVTFLCIPATLASYVFSPWVPTPSKLLEEIKELSELSEGEHFYDLGCGDGRVVHYMSQTTQAYCVGIEYSPFHFTMGYLKTRPFRYQNLELRRADMYKVDISEVDVIYIYGSPININSQLYQKLKTELKPGARIISLDHKVGSFPVERTLNSSVRKHILYRHIQQDNT